jgi:hypothetical protein
MSHRTLTFPHAFHFFCAHPSLVLGPVLHIICMTFNQQGRVVYCNPLLFLWDDSSHISTITGHILCLILRCLAYHGRGLIAQNLCTIRVATGIFWLLIWFLPFFYTRNGDISNLTVDGDRNANQKNLQPPKSGTANFIRELFLFWCITCCPHQIFWRLLAEHNLIKAMRNHTYKNNTRTESTPLLNKLNTFHTHT